MKSPTQIPKGKVLKGAERLAVVEALGKRYLAGETLRKLADSTGRSYGCVHRLVGESGVTLRPRGGARKRKPPQTPLATSAGPFKG